MEAQQNILTTRPKFLLNKRKCNFIIVGAGGTGSYLVRDLGRLVSINNEKYKTHHTITLVDSDIVEKKNLTRQNFILSDVGKNKAQVLAQRYSRAYGIEISYMPEYLNSKNKDEFISYDSAAATVLIGCVDNNKTRHLLHDIHRRAYGTSIYIDSGNEEHGGQVVFSANNTVDLIRSSRNAIASKSVMINDIVEQFDLDSNDKHPEEMSCAEHAESAPQNIATNIMAANIIFGYTNLIMASSGIINDTDLRNEAWTLATGKDNAEKFAKYASTLPSVAAHVSYFNSNTGQISTKAFDTF